MKIKAVIPTLGERTEGLCAELVGRQVDAVELVRGLARWEAIYESWRLGLDADVLVLLPSDMLVRPGVVQQLVEKLKEHKADRVSGHCRSKFRGDGSGGISVYDTGCLPRLMRISKTLYRNSIRPESEPVVRHFKYKVFSDVMTGLHEYELDYKEIYDRYIFQKVKHHKQVMRMVPAYQQKAVSDFDYIAVLQALESKDFSMDKKEPITNHTSIIKRYDLG